MFKSILTKVGLGELPSNFAYTVGDKVDLPFSSIWDLHRGQKRSDGSAVSVFVCAKKDQSPATLAKAKNAEQVGKMMRYPNVLRTFDSVETAGGLYLVTESVTPLLTFDTAREQDNGEVVVWGLYQALDALNFMHNSGFTHGLFGPSSIFVTPRGDFRLAGFELCQKGADASSLLAGRRQCGPNLMGWPDPPSALADGGAPTQVVDFWGATVMIAYIFGSARSRRRGPDYRPDVARAAEDLPADLRKAYGDLQKIGPLRGKSPIANFIALQYFNEQPIVRIMSFLRDLQIKSDAEKEEFFEHLPGLIEEIPQKTQTIQVLPELLEAEKFPGHESAQVLPAILKIGVQLKEDEFKEKVAPLVVNLFTSPDRAIRFRLLMSLGDMINNLDDKMINDKIFPECMNGFTDSNAPIREATVKSMIHFAPRLKQATLESRVVKQMMKLLQDPEPSIRTNTVICSGRISSNLPETARRQTLMTAFTGGLKDPFSPCRSASLHTLMATATEFSSEDLACRLMPLICQRLVDPDPSVSSTAFEVMVELQKHLRQQVEQDRAAQQAAAEAAGAAAANSAGDSSAAAGQQGRWGSWMSSGRMSQMLGAMGSMGAIGSKDSSSSLSSMASPPASTEALPQTEPPPQQAAPQQAAPQQAPPQSAPAKAAPRGSSGMKLGSAATKASSPKAAPVSNWDDDNDFWEEFGDIPDTLKVVEPKAAAPKPKAVEPKMAASNTAAPKASLPAAKPAAPKAAGLSKAAVVAKPAAKAPVAKVIDSAWGEDDDFFKEFD